MMNRPSSTVEMGDEAPALPECFVVMPIADSDGYTPGHFKHVYHDIIAPACGAAGFRPVRADDVKQTNLIHLDILQKLLDSPMCLCDLSTRNPNVLFELALRQAFDKPVALIQEVGTKPIFDIAPLRYTDYRKERIYHEVIEDQAKVSESLKDTFDAFQKGKGINSIVRLLSLSQPAQLSEPGEMERQSDLQSLLLAEIEQMRGEFRSAVRTMQMATAVDESSSRFARRFNDIQMHIATLDNMLRHSDVPGGSAAEIDMVLSNARSNLQDLMSAAQHSDKEMSMVFEVDQRLDRLEQEFHRMLERPGLPRRRTRPSTPTK